MSFQSSLTFGRQYELKFVEHLTQSCEYDDIEILPTTERFVEYDIITRGKTGETKWEVKADRIAAKTGNFCIEFESSGKPSGLSLTKADYWAYYIVDGKNTELFVIPVGDLRVLVTSQQFRKLKGGDKWRSHFYLIPRERFAQYLVKNKPIDE